ncbi:thioredoxin family protein [Mycoplasma sp. SG1]|uniref:thioredoxin family protein n=1 Tax=Mycoplasma sp. SG1 TaxID=2810348 RepID=UPI00202580FC|nr:thioredoxin domain-containing protein [Mycoplasma sp. SG1]URM52763.1 thioredoxin fold domain-containing protein [Mycoplasma sp. SG1]
MGNTIIITKKEFEKILQSTDELFIVDFFAEWCGPCRMLSQVVDELNKTQSTKIYKFNVDSDRAFANQIWKVSSIPALIFFKNKKEIFRTEGFKTKEMLEAYIKNYQ